MRLVISTLAVAIAACAQHVDDQERPREPEPIRVSVQPPDATSSMRNSPVIVRLSRNGPEIGDEIVAEIAKTVRVLRDGEQIAVDLRITPKPNPNEYLDVRRDIEVIVPNWASAWHEVRVTPVPGVIPSRLVPSASGEYASRFHPDSQPVVRLVRLCRSEPIDKVTVSFSENVLWNPSDDVAAQAISVHLERVECVPVWGFLEDGGVPKIEQSVDSASFACDHIVDEPDEVTLDIRAVRTPGGSAVSLLGSKENSGILALSLSSAIRDEEGCYFWRP